MSSNQIVYNNKYNMYNAYMYNVYLYNIMIGIAQLSAVLIKNVNFATNRIHVENINV